MKLRVGDSPRFPQKHGDCIGQAGQAKAVGGELRRNEAGHLLPSSPFAHSCPFVCIRGSESSLPTSFRAFSCVSCFSWFKSPLPLSPFAHSCPFVSIRGSESSLPTSFRVFFVYFRVFRGLNPLFPSPPSPIRAHSCPFVVQNHPCPRHFVLFRAFRVFRGLNSSSPPLRPLRAPSCPFVSIRGSELSLPTSFRGFFRVFAFGSQR